MVVWRMTGPCHAVENGRLSLFVFFSYTIVATGYYPGYAGHDSSRAAASPS